MRIGRWSVSEFMRHSLLQGDILGRMRRSRIVIAGALGLAALAVALGFFMMREPSESSVVSPHADATFVGSARCADCHVTEHRAWKSSQHAKAMQPATAKTVLGDFADARFSYAGVTSSFFQRDGRFFVRTDGANGVLSDFEVKYTFGIEPIQQYLIELPGGRLQALSISWDTRPRDQGGQRWFHLYPDERVDHRDELHWTQPSQNWNTQCADCHSTNVVKGFDESASTFATTWSDVSVGCEACHGPGSTHIAKPSTPYRLGNDTDRAAVEMESCAACHARRAQFAEGARAGDALLDHYLPTTLSEGLYHVDGQQQGEVFVWGSFLQSKHHQAGVTCASCHDPHTQQLKKPGNATCTQCHAAKEFDVATHHHHDAASAVRSSEPRCVDCHMREKTYMVIDPRRDHGFHSPRPDLSLKLGVPNACNDCHVDRDARWADEIMADWYGSTYRDRPHFGETLYAARRGDTGAVSKLLTLLQTPKQPGIVRATAIELLSRYPGEANAATIRQKLSDPDPLVRRQAVLAQAGLPAHRRIELLAPLITDPRRAVRHEVAQQLADVRDTLESARRERLDVELSDLERSLRHDLSRAQSWLNLASLQSSRRDLSAAEQSLRRAIALEPRFAPAYVNLADLLRASGREAEAEALLRRGIASGAAAPSLREALGFSLVRQGRKREALEAFAMAHREVPDEPRYRYVYALALHDAGRPGEAVRLLESGVAGRFDRDSLVALASWASTSGDEPAARRAIDRLRAVNPADPAVADFDR